MRTRTGGIVLRGRVWYAVWQVNYRKFRQSTKKSDRREALTELRRIMQTFAAGDELATLERVKARIEGLREDVARAEDTRNPPLTLTAAWSAFLGASGRPDSGPVTLKHYEGQFGQFVSWMKTHHPGAVGLCDVTPAIANAYAAHLSRERGVSANTYNKHVRALELVFRVLKEAARLWGNPWEGVQRKRAVPQSRRELTVAELKSVCEAAKGELRSLLALGVYTGLRLGDAATLRWGEVDLARRVIRRIPGKTSRRSQKPVVVPIHGVLAALLREVPSDERGEYVLPELAALYQRDPPALSNRIQKHFRACGVQTVKHGTGCVIEKGEDGRERTVSTGTRAVVEVGFHSLRHTFVSLCRESNAPLSVVEAIVGHSNPAMTRHYTHVSELAAAHAVNALPAVLGHASMHPAPTRDEALRKIIKGLNVRTVKRDKARLLALLDASA